VLACVGRRCPCRRVRSWFRWSASGASGGRYRQVVKFNELIANAAIYSTALDITDVANALAAEGHPVDTDDLAAVTPTSPARSAASSTGSWTSSRPGSSPVTRLDLQPRVLFPTSTA
jgi:Tn3 transposase DDE domain